MVNWSRFTRLLTPSQHVSHGTLRNSFDRRSAIIGTIQGGIGVLLATRLGYLAVAQNEKYKLAAESNRVNLSLIPPRRGWILDRHDQPMGNAVFLWSLAVIVLDVVEARLPWRSFLVEWLVAIGLIVAYPLVSRFVALGDRFRLVNFRALA